MSLAPFRLVLTVGNQLKSSGLKIKHDLFIDCAALNNQWLVPIAMVQKRLRRHRLDVLHQLARLSLRHFTGHIVGAREHLAIKRALGTGAHPSGITLMLIVAVCLGGHSGAPLFDKTLDQVVEVA